MTGATRSKGQVALSSMGQGSCLPLALAIEGKRTVLACPNSDTLILFCVL